MAVIFEPPVRPPHPKGRRADATAAGRRRAPAARQSPAGQGRQRPEVEEPAPVLAPAAPAQPRRAARSTATRRRAPRAGSAAGPHTTSSKAAGRAPATAVAAPAATIAVVATPAVVADAHAEALPATVVAAPTAPRLRRRTMRPRQFAVTIAVALAGALLLNAASMERSARTSEFGLRRTAALAVLHPLAVLSQVLWLDRPRMLLDRLGGGGDLGGVASSTHDISDGSPLTGGDLLPVAAGATAARRPASADRILADRVPTRANPLRIWVGGDSVSGFFGFGIDDLARAMGTVSAHSHYEISTGLSRPDYYDWPAHLEADMRTYNPEVVFFMVGANDDQPLEVGGRVYDVGSDGWKAEYARRVGAVMDRLLAEGRMVVWVGQPVMRSGDFDVRIQVMNGIYRAEAERRPRVMFFDSRPVLANADGGYSAYLPDGNGDVTLMRYGDGIHLTPAGGRRLAHAVLDAVLTELASRGESAASTGIR